MCYFNRILNKYIELNFNFKNLNKILFKIFLEIFILFFIIIDKIKYKN